MNLPKMEYRRTFKIKYRFRVFFFHIIQLFIYLFKFNFLLDGDLFFTLAIFLKSLPIGNIQSFKVLKYPHSFTL